MRLHFIFLFQLIFLFCACKKESSILKDTGKIYAYGVIKKDSAIQIGEIYHTTNFAAFTDLAFYNGIWYAVFRVGTSHAQGENGHIKILTSADGSVWQVANDITMKNIDLRDPKLTIDSFNNNFYLSFFARNVLKSGRIDIRNYVTEYNKITNNWGAITEIKYNTVNGDQFVFWRYTYHNSKMYCAAYRTPVLQDGSDNLYLFVNDNIFSVYKPVEKLKLGGTASETTLRFSEDGDIYLIARTETINSPIGILRQDYSKTNWIKNPLLSILASPDFLFYKNKLLITGRDSKQNKFKFFCYDLNLKKVEKTYTFPSGHETGYGGMSFNPANENELWITYYSISGTSSSINLAKINLLKFL